MISRILSFAVAFMLVALSSSADRRPIRLQSSMGAVPEAGGGYSVMLPIVGKVVGSVLYYTSVDVTNTTTSAVPVSYFFFSNDYSVRVSGSLTTLGPRGNFHREDIIQFLVEQGKVSASQAGNLFGTFFVTFDNASFTNGTEASAIARVYNYTTGSAANASVGLAYRGIVMREGGSHTLRSVIRNSAGATSIPSVVTNFSVQNMVVDDSGNATTTPINVTVNFYDTRSGALIKSAGLGQLQPGQSTGIYTAWTQFGLPAELDSVLMEIVETGTAQISGWVSIKDTFTNDGSFFFME